VAKRKLSTNRRKRHNSNISRAKRERDKWKSRAKSAELGAERAEEALHRAKEEIRVLRERAERAERAARVLRAEARAQALPVPKRAAQRPKTALADRWKLPKYQHRSNIIQGIYKLLVKGVIPLNDPSITDKEIARLLEEHDLLGPPPQPRGDLVRRVGLPRGETLARYVGETIAHHGRGFQAPELSKDQLRALTFAALSETAAHARSPQSK
jgi:hypothetical protein